MSPTSYLTLFATTALAASSLSTSLAAQINHETSPRGYYRKHGDTYTNLLGSHPDGRYQFADEGLRGKRMTIHLLWFRPDAGRNYYAGIGMGRSWDSMKLLVGETNVHSLKSDGKNYKGAATEVYNAKTRWATLTGRPSGYWGQGAPYIPFRKPYSYSGRDGLLMDFVFAGGKLANNVGWTYQEYWLDGTRSPVRTAVATVARYPRTTTCNDSLVGTTHGAALQYQGIVHAKDSLSSLRGQYELRHYTTGTAPFADVVQVASFGGSAKGVSIGAACNKLHVDLNQILGATVRRADASGRTTYSTGNGFYRVRYDNAWAGLTLWYQGAWTDSVTRRMSLTRAAKVTLPKQPANLAKKSIRFRHRNNKLGAITVLAKHQLLPLFGYR